MKNTILSGVLLGLSGVILSGCVAAAVGVGAAAGYGALKYVENESYRDYPASLDDTWQATLAMLRRIGHEAPQESLVESKGYIEFDDIRLWVEPQSDEWTRVRVRLGTFDSEVQRRRSKAMLDAVDEKLRDLEFGRSIGPAPVRTNTVTEPGPSR